MKKITLIALLISLISCNSEVAELKTIDGNAIGTTFSIRYLDSSSVKFEGKIIV